MQNPVITIPTATTMPSHPPEAGRIFLRGQRQHRNGKPENVHFRPTHTTPASDYLDLEVVLYLNLRSTTAKEAVKKFLDLLGNGAIAGFYAKRLTIHVTLYPGATTCDAGKHNNEILAATDRFLHDFSALLPSEPRVRIDTASRVGAGDAVTEAVFEEVFFACRHFLGWLAFQRQLFVRQVGAQGRDLWKRAEHCEVDALVAAKVARDLGPCGRPNMQERVEPNSNAHVCGAVEKAVIIESLADTTTNPALTSEVVPAKNDREGASKANQPRPGGKAARRRWKKAQKKAYESGKD
ncbi:hypothetical protein MKZ38_002682 [Zalerion maritima]|uniref:Uncharacterized protein n=1 Tax=Zalerion maritima TaxID=339359 RepID=A0AAD5RQ83_9PEZI|nr:hypothetical protein MKZ38_002682 [Zalerion maritima]